VLKRDPVPPTLVNRFQGQVMAWIGGGVRWTWSKAQDIGGIGPRSTVSRRFGSFGDGSIICFPNQTIVNEHAIHIGCHTTIAPDVALSAGWGPGHPNLPPRVVVIGDRSLIGRGSSVIGHASIEIGDDVWTGHHVHITDMNHGYDDVDLPISVQNQPAAPVSIGDGSWLGHGTIVLPGARIGRHVVIGANSVVTGEIPDYSVAVGAPARVICRYVEGEGWVPVDNRLRAVDDARSNGHADRVVGGV
jgi:acetyltransferase-like isoleucine patch superfamily enzyme